MHYNKITGAALLRADIKSQQIFLMPKDGTEEEKCLVEPSQFWGDGKGSGLYYHYLDAGNHGWSVAKDGWRDYSLDSANQMNNIQTNQWLQNNVFRDDFSSLTVIQGYAGCGKTIFINSILRSLAADTTNQCLADVYIDYDNDLSEDGYLVNTIRNIISDLFVSYLASDDGDEIYNKFRSLLVRYKDKAASINSIIPLFNPTGLITQYLLLIHQHRKNSGELQSAIEQFEMQFLCGTKASAATTKSELIPSDGNLSSLSNVDEGWMQLLLEHYLVMHLLLLHAANIVRNKNQSIVVYDNLDIIDNPKHIAFLIRKLQEILFKFSQLSQKLEKPIFNIILAVRKVTVNRIASEIGDEVEPDAILRYMPAKFLDISNLYSATVILRHKAEVLSSNLNELIPEAYRDTALSQFLESIKNLPVEVLEEISLSDLFNHNIRACANVLEYAINRSNRMNFPIEQAKALPNNCSSTIWLNNICAILQESEVWNSLGFDTHNETNIHYLASSSRLILTFLYNKRRESQKKIAGTVDGEATLKEIVESLERFLIIPCRKRLNHKEMRLKAAENYTGEDARKEIIKAIANMLGRNRQLSGFDPSFEKELWRRPIYYTHHTFPLVDSQKNSLVYNELCKQLSQMKDPNAQITSFCITDEGYTFIEKVVTSFEFFSVRVNGNEAQPLCTITEHEKLEKIIGNVYRFVKETVEDHVWLMMYHLKYANKSDNPTIQQRALNVYLNKPIHPRTEENQPQLHIVRTIFDHIYALNHYRDYLIRNKYSNIKMLNYTLVKWIGTYLALYKKSFYDLLDNTVGSYNNVYLDLKYLYLIVAETSDYLPKDERDIFISIDRKNTSGISRKKQSKITDQRLLLDDHLI